MRHATRSLRAVLGCLTPCALAWLAEPAIGAPGDVSANPDTRNLPGGGVLQNLTDGIAGWALVLALLGLLVGAALWALGSHSQNWHQTHVGKRAVMVSALAALLIGAAPAVINFFAGQGRLVR